MLLTKTILKWRLMLLNILRNNLILHSDIKNEKIIENFLNAGIFITYFITIYCRVSMTDSQNEYA